MKGADTVMHNVVQYNDWMDEEVTAHSLNLSYFNFVHGLTVFGSYYPVGKKEICPIQSCPSLLIKLILHK